LNFEVRRNEERQKELEKEKIALNESIEYYKQLELTDQQRVIDKNVSFQKDLIGQIEYNEHLKQRVIIKKFYNRH